MSQQKPKHTLEGQPCPFCNEGELKLEKIEHQAKFPDQDNLTIPNVWIDKCNHCGEVVYPPETTQFIEQAVDDYFESLTPIELQQIRKTVGLDQTEMSELLCLGSKTYHRWENGDQFPNRSMSCYIRIIAEFPEVLEWLRSRSWRKKEYTAKASINPVEIEFPSLKNMRQLWPSEVQIVSDAAQKFNYADAFSNIGVK